MTEKNRSARRTFMSVLMFMLSLANFLRTILKYNICVKLSFRQEAQESNLKEIDL